MMLQICREFFIYRMEWVRQELRQVPQGSAPNIITAAVVGKRVRFAGLCVWIAPA